MNLSTYQNTVYSNGIELRNSREQQKEKEVFLYYVSNLDYWCISYIDGLHAGHHRQVQNERFLFSSERKLYPCVSDQNAFDRYTGGFAGALGALGIVVALGAILGSLLSMSGATEQLAAGVLRAAGKERSSLAMNIIGFIISIPVYMGSAYIILNPLCKNLSKDTKKNVFVFTTALSIGLLVTHCLVIPTPGPLAVANTLGIDIGWFILYALLVSIAASLTGGWLYGKFMGKKYPYEELIEDLKEDTAEETDSELWPQE